MGVVHWNTYTIVLIGGKVNETPPKCMVVRDSMAISMDSMHIAGM